jgi:WD repeat-containing protein 24
MSIMEARTWELTSKTAPLQKWDMRNLKPIYDRKVSAHNGPCLTVDWHSDGRTLASGGRDRTIKVG